ncbi:MAG: mycofactocin-associated electron transfer flavoprotein beta subunit, partial [Acidimicrobiales bacterium]
MTPIPPADRDPSGHDVVVCLKWVPISPEIDPLTGVVTTDQRFRGLSPADRTALEWALRIAEVGGGSVTAVSLGTDDAEAGLREALAHGASAAARVAAAQPDQLTSRAVARALAPSCGPASLVLCGDHSLDRGSGSVPAFLAAELGLGQALGCIRLETTADGAVVRPLVAERRLDQGRRERLAITGPAVLSFEGGLELRRAPLGPAIESADVAIPVVQPAPVDEPGGRSTSVSV